LRISTRRIRLARFLLRDAAIAKDAVQDACLKAFNAFDRMHGPDARIVVPRGRSQRAAWILLRERRDRAHDEEYDEDEHVGRVASTRAHTPATPEDLAIACLGFALVARRDRGASAGLS
jgi:DNA-directed RNA polymerase specialized sigma24 family protein